MLTENSVTCPDCRGSGRAVSDAPLADREKCLPCKGTGRRGRCTASSKLYKVRTGGAMRCDMPAGHKGKHRRLVEWDDRCQFGEIPSMRAKGWKPSDRPTPSLDE